MLERQAGILQKVTRFGDEETLAAAARLAAFVKEEDQIRRLIPLIQDFATAKQMDLASAAELVGKSLGSSTNALTRYGIEVSGQVGSQERFNTLMENMTKQVDGAAEAAANAAGDDFASVAGTATQAVTDQEITELTSITVGSVTVIVLPCWRPQTKRVLLPR